MWFSFYVALAVASSGCVIAFPQDDASDVSSQSVFRVDGFVFDGPVSGQRDSTIAQDDESTSTPVSTSSPSTTIAPNVQLDQCIATCPATPEYNPVCGTDNVIYDNIGKLNCATTCGKEVALLYYGRCTTTKIRGG